MALLINSIHTVSKGAFLWDDPDQDQWAEINRAMVDQMNRWILVQGGFIGSFNLPWSEWSRNTDPDPNHLKGTHPTWFLGRGLVKSCGRQEYHGNDVMVLHFVANWDHSPETRGSTWVLKIFKSFLWWIRVKTTEKCSRFLLNTQAKISEKTGKESFDFVFKLNQE